MKSNYPVGKDVSYFFGIWKFVRHSFHIQKYRKANRKYQ